MSCWVFPVCFVALLILAVTLAVFLILPNACKHYLSWKKTGNEKFLSPFFSDFFVGVFLLVAVFILVFAEIWEWIR